MAELPGRPWDGWEGGVFGLVAADSFVVTARLDSGCPWARPRDLTTCPSCGHAAVYSEKMPQPIEL